MRGRKRKTGPRQPNGQLCRNAGEHERSIQLTVLAQPHRQGNLDQRCDSAVGRFCIRHGLSTDITNAADEYATIVRLWRSAKGIPQELRLGIGGTGNGPSDEVVWGWGRRRLEIEIALDRARDQCRYAVGTLVLDGYDLGLDQDAVARIGLEALAIELGWLRDGKRRAA